MKKLLTFLILLAAPTAWGQGVRKDDILLGNRGTPLANQTVTVCTSAGTGTPCTPLATIYTDATLTTAAANPTTTDALGNYGFWAAPGKYIVTFTGSQIATPKTLTVVLSCDPSAACTHSGTETFTGNATMGNLNNVRFVDGVKFTTIAAAIADLPATGGTVDARRLEGAQTISSTITLNKPVRVILGAGTFTASLAPAFDLTSEGASLEGQAPGAPTGTASPTVIKATTGATGPLVRINISSGAKGGIVRNLLIDGNNKQASVTAGLEIASGQVNRNIVEDVSFNQLTTGLLVSSNVQSQKINRLHAQNVDVGLDLSAVNIRDVSVKDSRIVCDVQCFIVGPDDAVSGNAASAIRFVDSDFTLNASGTRVGIVQNARGFRINGGWYEVSSGLTPAGDSMVRLGGASSTPNNPSIVGAHFEGNGSIAHGIEFFSTFWPAVLDNDFFNLTTKPVKVTATNTQGVVFGNNGSAQTGSPVTAVTGLALVTGDSTLTNPAFKTPFKADAASGTDLVELFVTGEANARWRLRNSGVIMAGPGGATAPATWATVTGAGTVTLSGTTSAIASGTATMTAGAITAATCQTAITVAATGTATTDGIEWAYATAPALTTDALLQVSAYVTTGNVNFTRCNPTAGSITGTAIVINWRVVR